MYLVNWSTRLFRLSATLLFLSSTLRFFFPIGYISESWKDKGVKSIDAREGLTARGIFSPELTQLCLVNPHDRFYLTSNDRVGQFNFEAMINLDKTVANRRILTAKWDACGVCKSVFAMAFREERISLLLSRSLSPLSRSRFISRSTVLGVVGIFEGWGDGSDDASYVGAIKRASKEEAEESGGVRDWRHSMTSSRTVQKARWSLAHRAA